MTLEELSHSDVVKQWLSTLLQNRTFSAILDALQKMALPTKHSTPMLVPGVHHDTTIAHDRQYWAGWNDCIEFLRAVPTGEPQGYSEPEEELFAHTPEVQEIDKAIEAAKHQPKTA